MVELGEREEELNYEFGKKAAVSCDYIILVGKKRTEPILRGIKEGNFPEDNIYIAKNLNEALEHMKKITKRGSVVLFENDLPDNYEE